MKLNHEKIYNAEIVAGSLLVRESRLIARLLLNDADPGQWHHAVVVDNLLQKRAPATARRQARLIKNRLSLMKPEIWEIISNGPNDAATQALLAAAVKHSRLLGDFMDKVIRQLWRTFTPQISDKDWRDYITSCAQIDPGIDRFSNATQAKLKQVVFRILAEAKYINNTKSLHLLPASVIPEIRQYLFNNGEHYALRCMEAAH